MLREGESPRVRVVVDVRPGNDGVKVVVFTPDASKRERAFLGSRVATLEWNTAVDGKVAAS